MVIPWTNEEIAAEIVTATRFYWGKRSGQSNKQRQHGKRDAGTRGEVTGGKHLDGFMNILFDIGRKAGFNAGEILAGKDFPIPGYYRPQKNWDLVYVKGSKLVAVVELKSQSGSFGNNYNNRSEEVLGVSHDFWKAYREKALGVSHAPWIGYFFMLEGSEKSERPISIRLRKSFLPPMDIFKGSSYMRRYEILFERMVQERDYSATSLLVTTKSGGVLPCSNPNLSFASFCESLYRHLVANS